MENIASMLKFLLGFPYIVKKSAASQLICRSLLCFTEPLAFVFLVERVIEEIMYTLRYSFDLV